MRNKNFDKSSGSLEESLTPVPNTFVSLIHRNVNSIREMEALLFLWLVFLKSGDNWKKKKKNTKTVYSKVSCPPFVQFFASE